VLEQDLVSGVLVQDLGVSGVLVQDLGVSVVLRHGRGGQLGHGGGLWGRQPRRRNWGGKESGGAWPIPRPSLRRTCPP